MKKVKDILCFIKDKVIEYFKNIITVFKENKLLVVYIIGAILNGILLRLFTIGFQLKISPILADTFIVLCFSCLYFLFKTRKSKFIYLLVISIISCILSIANAVYYYYFSSFISVTFISFVLTNSETGDANVVGDLIQIKYFILLFLPIIVIVANKLIKKEKTKINKKDSIKSVIITAIIFLLLFISTLKSVDYGRFNNQWNREYLVSKFGLYLYQLNDIVKSVEPKMAALFGSDQAYKKINEYYENKEEDKANEYTDIFKGKNVIAVHAESMQNFVLNYSINGVELTPNLNRLSKEGLYFSNFYPEVSLGTSSDTEFTLATSLLPVSSGTVFINYYDREYETIYKNLQKEGYYTFSMHANTGDFWNRNAMYKKIGYEYFYDKASYEIDETVGFGLSDKSFIHQSVEYIKEIAKEHEHFYGTLITLSNHTPFDYSELYENIDVSMHVDGQTYPYMEGTKLGNYFKSVHYADEALGLLVDELDKAGILDNTIIVIYGDHDARISLSNYRRLFNYDYKTDSTKENTEEGYVTLDYYWQELNRKTPLIIYSKSNPSVNREITTVTGMYDLAPTLGNMLGVRNKYALGKDVMNTLEDNLVVFPNGNYITNYVYYNDNKGEYKMLQDVPLSDDYIESNKNKSKELLDLSDDIIVYNYFKKIQSENKYEVEQ